MSRGRFCTAATTVRYATPCSTPLRSCLRLGLRVLAAWHTLPAPHLCSRRTESRLTIDDRSPASDIHRSAFTWRSLDLATAEQVQEKREHIEDVEKYPRGELDRFVHPGAPHAVEVENGVAAENAQAEQRVDHV